MKALRLIFTIMFLAIMVTNGLVWLDIDTLLVTKCYASSNVQREDTTLSMKDSGVRQSNVRDKMKVRVVPNSRVGAGSKLGNSKYIKGDVNSDGKITITDLSQLKLFLLDKIDQNVINRDSADINGDGKVTLTDLSLLKQMLIGGEKPSTYYETKTLVFNDVDSWIKEIGRAQASVTSLGRFVTYGSGKQYYTGSVITGMKVKKYKSIPVKIPAAQGPNVSKYVTRLFLLPEMIEFRMHKHDIKNKFFFNVSSFHFWQECECGYRDEWYWDLPWPDTSDAQTSQSTIKAMPRQTVIRFNY